MSNKFKICKLALQGFKNLEGLLQKVLFNTYLFFIFAKIQKKCVKKIY